MKMYLVLLLAVALVGCNPVPEKGELIYSASNDSTYKGSDFEQARAVLTTHCLSCHGTETSRTFKFSPKWEETEFIQKGIAIPQDTKKSLATRRMQYSGNSGANMPTLSSSFSEKEYLIVAKWINGIGKEEEEKDPNVTIASPIPEQYVSSDVTIHGSCVTEYNVVLHLNNQLLKTIACSDGSFSSTFNIGLPDGRALISAIQSNKLGITSKKDVYIRKDTVAPGLEIFFPTPNYTYSDNTLSIAGSCEAGISINLMLGSQTRMIPCLSNGSFSTILDTPTVGNFSILLQQIDEARNSASRSVSVTKQKIETSIPQINITSPSQGSTHSGGTTIIGSCAPLASIALSGDITAKSISCSASGSFETTVALTTGNGIKTIILEQTLSQQSNSKTLVINNDQTPPVISVSTPINNSSINKTIIIQGTCENGLTINVSGTSIPSQTLTCTSGAFTFAYIPMLPEGVKSITFSQQDAAKNNSSVTLTSTYDITPPNLQIDNSEILIDGTTANISGRCESGQQIAIQTPTTNTTTTCPSSRFFHSINYEGSYGQQSVTITQLDSAGNKAEKIANITRKPKPAMLAEATVEILRSRCMACHFAGWKTPMNSTADLPTLQQNSRIVPGKPLESSIIKKMFFGPNHNNDTVSKMPPEFSDQFVGFNQIEYQVIYDYIASLAPVVVPEGGESEQGPRELVCNPDVQAKYKLKRLTKIQYTNTVRDILNLRLGATLGSTVLNEMSQALTLIPNDYLKHDFPELDLSINSTHYEGYFNVAYELGIRIGSDNSRLAAFTGETCSSTYSDNVCRDRIIDRIAPIILRHPLSLEELSEIKISAASFATYHELISYLFLNPNFLYHTEFRGKPSLTNPNMIELTPHEYANRISYLFSQSMPDLQLSTAAANNTIFTNNSVVVTDAFNRYANRNFKYNGLDRNSTSHFLAGWLEVDETPGLQPEIPLSTYTKLISLEGVGNTSLPNLNLESYRLEVISEMLNLMKYHTHISNGKVSDLLTSPYSFARGNLAKAYGVAPWGLNFGSLVTLPAEQRSGILTRAGFNYYPGVKTRPILKGVKVIKKLLCEDIQPPADNNTPDGIIIHDDFTVRETTNAITLKPGTSCVTCHARINPLGFATEDFDVLGRFRTDEHVIRYIDGTVITTKPADANATPQLEIGDGLQTDSGVEFSAHLAQSGKVDQCFTQMFYRYAYQRQLDYEADACDINTLTQKVKSEGIKPMMIALATSTNFKNRSIASEIIQDPSPTIPSEPVVISPRGVMEPLSIQMTSESGPTNQVVINGKCDPSMNPKVSVRTYLPTESEVIKNESFASFATNTKWHKLILGPSNVTREEINSTSTSLNLPSKSIGIWGLDKSLSAVSRNDLAGNFEISTELTSFSAESGNLSPSAFAGLMLSNNFNNYDLGSANTFTFGIDGNRNLNISYRNQPGTDLQTQTVLSQIPAGSVFLRIKRDGELIQASYKLSSTGVWIVALNEIFSGYAHNPSISLISISGDNNQKSIANFKDFNYRSNIQYSTEATTVQTECKPNGTFSFITSDTNSQQLFSFEQNSFSNSISFNKAAAQSSTIVLGRDTGTSSILIAANTTFFTQHTATQRFVIERLNIRLPSTLNSGSIKLGLYSDSNNKPQNILAETDHYSLQAGLLISIPVKIKTEIAAGQKYWLAVRASNEIGILSDNTSGLTFKQNAPDAALSNLTTPAVSSLHANITPRLYAVGSVPGYIPDTPVMLSTPSTIAATDTIAFAAVGHLGRFMMSCNGGQTWIKNQSLDDNKRCWIDAADPRYVECDHKMQPGNGVLIHNRQIFKSYGWGESGPISTSSNGNIGSWNVVINSVSGQGLQDLESNIILGANYPIVSNDGGNSFVYSLTAKLPKATNVHVDNTGIAVNKAGEKLIALVGRNVDAQNGFEVAFTLDGKSYLKSVMPYCGTVGRRKVVSGQNFTLFYSENGICRTDNFGITTQHAVMPANENKIQHIIYNGQEFHAISRTKRYRSIDGINWDSGTNLVFMTTARFFDPVIHYDNQSKQWVAIAQSWGAYYEKQKALYSNDGITWLEGTNPIAPNGDGGHPIRRIASGIINKTSCE